ncbi:nuclear transport factor 2 family protein [Nocardioides euryhalodurans]|uniref:Isomerase n=1 Tax=Nocardioides euryhalodurans TaxID=2518370 RepID=A0A4V1BE31_9ACTN|nr:nuclear transport factor 2 family protein [Nocardioides euryhalodurans]QBR93202.1 isomerase [Nocardioides euryhalodurans]
MSDTTTQAPTSPGLQAVQRYVAFWNTADPDEQIRLAAETFTDHVRSHVPVGVLRGSEELIGFRNRFAQHAPDYSFRARVEPDAHHTRARLQWELLTGGTTFATGTDVLELDGAGRIASITGFLDQAPEGFDPDAPHD